MTDQPNWPQITADLAAPFPADLIEFRPQGSLNDQGRGRAIAYIDARAVAERLDQVVGAGNWAFDWQPMVVSPDNAAKKDPLPHDVVWIVKGTITIYGVSKSDIGDAGDTEASKSAVSDALKRTAVLWGVGRYLYSLGAEWVEGKQLGRSWVITDAELHRLRAKLGGKTPRPGPLPVVPAEPLISQADQDQIKAACGALGWGKGDAQRYLAQYGVTRFGELTAAQAADVVPDLLAKAADVQPIFAEATP